MLVVLLPFGLVAPAAGRDAGPAIARFLDEVGPGDLVPGADGFGEPRADLPVVPALEGEERLGWVFLNSDIAGSTGYSGKPIHVLVGMNDDAVITGAVLVKHYEPIVLVGIPEQKIKDLIGRFVGLDIKQEAAGGDPAHDLDIISGATVTVMVIDDSILQSGLCVARTLGLGGLAAETADDGPKRSIVTAAGEPQDWPALLGDGSVRRLSLDVGTINEAFAASGDAEAAQRPEPGRPDETFIDLYAAPVSVPAIGQSLLGQNEWANLQASLKEGRQAILVAARGRYSFKGSGYVRGGIFDRIQLVQGDRSVRFRDRDHRRLGGIAAEGAPNLRETVPPSSSPRTSSPNWRRAPIASSSFEAAGWWRATV